MSNSQKPRSGPQFVDEVPYGVYVWEIDGKWIGDGKGNYLRSPLCMRGNLRVINALTNEVRSMSRDAYEKGKPLFLAGRRAVSDEEYEEQIERSKQGLIPDKYDLPAQIESQRRRRR